MRFTNYSIICISLTFLTLLKWTNGSETETKPIDIPINVDDDMVVSESLIQEDIAPVPVSPVSPVSAVSPVSLKQVQFKDAEHYQQHDDEVTSETQSEHSEISSRIMVSTTYPTAVSLVSPLTQVIPTKQRHVSNNFKEGHVHNGPMKTAKPGMAKKPANPVKPMFYQIIKKVEYTPRKIQRRHGQGFGSDHRVVLRPVAYPAQHNVRFFIKPNGKKAPNGGKIFIPIMPKPHEQVPKWLVPGGSQGLSGNGLSGSLDGLGAYKRPGQVQSWTGGYRAKQHGPYMKALHQEKGKGFTGPLYSQLSGHYPQEDAFEGLSQGQGSPGLSQGQVFPGGAQGHGFSGVSQGQWFPGASQGQDFAGVSQGLSFPGVSQGQNFPGISHGQGFPDVSQGQVYPAVSQEIARPGTEYLEGEIVPNSEWEHSFESPTGGFDPLAMAQVYPGQFGNAVPNSLTEYYSKGNPGFAQLQNYQSKRPTSTSNMRQPTRHYAVQEQLFDIPPPQLIRGKPMGPPVRPLGPVITQHPMVSMSRPLNKLQGSQYPQMTMSSQNLGHPAPSFPGSGQGPLTGELDYSAYQPNPVKISSDNSQPQEDNLQQSPQTPSQIDYPKHYPALSSIQDFSPNYLRGSSENSEQYNYSEGSEQESSGWSYQPSVEGSQWSQPNQLNLQAAYAWKQKTQDGQLIQVTQESRADVSKVKPDPSPGHRYSQPAPPNHSLAHHEIIKKQVAGTLPSSQASEGSEVGEEVTEPSKQPQAVPAPTTQKESMISNGWTPIINN